MASKGTGVGRKVRAALMAILVPALAGLLAGCSTLTGLFSAPEPPAFTGKQAVCLNTSAYPGKSVEDIRLELVRKAKSAVLDKLKPAGSKPSPTPPDDTALNAVELRDDPVFFNGREFGDVCVQIDAVIPAKAMNETLLTKARMAEFCYTNATAPITEMPVLARVAAKRAFLADVNPRLASLPEDEADILLRNFQAERKDVDFSTGRYCQDTRAEYYKPAVQGYVPRDRAKEAAAQKAALNFKLDLSKRNVGDMLTELGRDVTLYVTDQGKGAGSLSGKDVEMVVAGKSGPDFTLRAVMSFAFEYASFGAKSYNLFQLRYANGQTQEIAAQFRKGDGGVPMVRFVTPDGSSEFAPWRGAVNVEEFSFTKSGNTMKLFHNGEFVYTFATRGDTLARVTVRLGGKNILYVLDVQSR